MGLKHMKFGPFITFIFVRVADGRFQGSSFLFFFRVHCILLNLSSSTNNGVSERFGEMYLRV